MGRFSWAWLPADEPGIAVPHTHARPPPPRPRPPPPQQPLQHPRGPGPQAALPPAVEQQHGGGGVRSSSPSLTSCRLSSSTSLLPESARVPPGPATGEEELGEPL